MTHYQAILEHIQADAPCSYNHVINWANAQGFGGSQLVNAIRRLLREKTISMYNEDDFSITIKLN